MIFRLLYKMRLALVVLLPLLLALAPAMAQTVVYEGVTTQLNVSAVAGHTYQWKIYSDATLDFALESSPGCPVAFADFTSGNTGPGVQVKWIKPGIYFYKVTTRDAAQCAMNLKVGMIKVLPIETKAVIRGANITGACKGVTLSASNSVGDQFDWSLVGQGGEISAATGVNTEFKLKDTYTGLFPASFVVKLHVSDHNGHSDETTITIKVDRPPHADVYLSGKYETDGTMIADGSISTGTRPNYNWFTTNGTIEGPNSQLQARLYGTGTYTFKITDAYDCPDDYSFDVKFDQIIARADYARISWADIATIPVLNNDDLPDNYAGGAVTITKPPMLGDAIPNPDGTVTYTPRDKRPGHDQFEYQICDAVPNCSKAMVTIDIYDSPISIPEGFSPNGDGSNEKLNFEGLDKYGESQLTVFTRTGSVVFKSDGYKNDWDGSTSKGSINNRDLVPPGTYYYILRLGVNNRTIKGFVYIAY